MGRANPFAGALCEGALFRASLLPAWLRDPPPGGAEKL